MNPYKIFTDATADIPADLLKQADLTFLPMEYTIDGEVVACADKYANTDYHDFYNALRGGQVATTSQISPEVYITAFSKAMEQGFDILYVCFSSGLSGCLQSAHIAKQELSEQFPDRKLEIVDSLGATGGEGLLVLMALEQQAKGTSLEQNVQWITSHRLNICHWFTVDDLMFLKRGGRIPATTALLGSALQIKPVMHVDDTGHLVNTGKVRGRRASMEALAQKFFEGAVLPKSQSVVIVHGDCKDDAMYLAQLLKKGKNSPKEVYVMPLIPIIGAHSGPGTIALFYYGDNH